MNRPGVPAAPAPAWLCPAGAPATARYTLVCLPYAGGGSAVFRPWQRYTRLMAVAGVHLPGRESRSGEPAFDRMEALADELSAVVTGVEGRFALFGHSMGGLLAFEVARRIRDLVGERLRALFIGACRPPQTPPVVRASELAAPQLVAHLVGLGGLPPEAALDREAVDVMLPSLRADLATVDTYRYREAEPLPYPIHVLCGTQDATCGPAQAEGWARHTTAGLRVQLLSGDHFFAFREPRRTVAAIEGALVDRDRTGSPTVRGTGMTSADPTPTVIELVRSRAKHQDAGIDGDTTLAALGIDSLAVVALIVDLEREFAVRFPAHMISHDVFRTVGTVCDAVALLRGRQPVPGPPAEERS